MDHKGKLPLLLLLSMLLSLTPSQADTLVLTDGRRLKGEVTVLGDEYHIKMKFGSLKFKASKVAEHIRDGAGTAPPPKQTDTPKAPKKASPDPALAALTPSQKAKVLKPLPPSASYKESKHYAVASAASSDFTKRYSSLFERVRKGYYKYFNDRGFDLKYHPEKLEAVIFKDQASFVRYAHNFGLSSAAAGFYATRTNQLYFYDNSSSRGAKASQASLEKFERHLENIKKQRKDAMKAKNGAAARQLGEFYRRERKRYLKFKKSLAEDLDDSNSSTTIHEAVHQLCYNSGLLYVSNLNPEWLVEGLAMLFEDPAVWQGRHVAKGNKQRIESLARGLKRGNKIDLRTMVSSRTPLIRRGDPGFAYASSWALIHFLIVGKWRKYKPRFYEFLKAVRALAKAEKGYRRRSREDAEAAQLKLFEDKFGDLGEIEKEFRDYVDDLIKD